MKLLERYLYALEKYLPFRERKEIIQELTSNIMDQTDELIQEGYTEETAITEILTKMGHPRDVASQYRNNDYIIAPNIRHLYFLILKIVVVASSFGVLIANIVEMVTEQNTSIDIVIQFFTAIGDMFNTAIASFGMVTIIFMIISKYVSNDRLTRLQQEPFDLSQLPELPIKEYKVSQVGSVFAILFAILFLLVLGFFPNIISVYYVTQNGVWVSHPIFTSTFDTFRYLFIASTILTILLESYHLYKNRKNTTTILLEYFQFIFVFIVLFSLIYNPDNFTSSFINSDVYSVVYFALRLGLGIGFGIGFIIRTIEVVRFLFRRYNSK